MSKMKGLDENTVSLYMGPSLALLMAICMWKQGDTPAMFFQPSFVLKDWALLIFFSVGTVLV